MSPADAFRKALVNKVVPFRFMGEDLRFSLSHALFSSFDVDAGSKLLLKTVAQRVDLAGVGSLLDLGCGVGVLGLSVKKKSPGIDLHSVDRDALALEFTTANAAANGIGKNDSGFTVGPALGLMHLPAREFDFILANLPAKAGRPALESMIKGLTRFLSAGGVIALVIVKTLEELAEKSLADGGYRIVYHEGTREHAVFHAQKTRESEPDQSLAPYHRGRMKAHAGKKTFMLETVFGLPEFDTLSFATHILASLLEKTEMRGRVLVWNPGQGYLPLAVLARSPEIERLSLGSRDLLSLEIARRNCLSVAGVDDASVEIRHAPSLFGLEEKFDALIVTPDADPGFPWYAHFLNSVGSALKPDGVCLSAAKSTFFGRIDFDAAGIRIVREKRTKGFRGIAFRV